MRSPAAIRTWGPEPLFAVIPAVAAFGAAGWIWLAHADAPRGAASIRITALRPVEGGDGSATVPIEAAYGVPDEKTLHNWPPSR